MERGRPHGGFTLIEIAVVLIIIGLIVGGILVGKNLIEAAELRKIATDVEKFKTATYTFRDKYNCLPGDCPNATDYLGVSSTGCQTPSKNSGRVLAPGGTGTCNGEGNYSFIGFQGGHDNDTGASGATAEDQFQKVLYFHHLGVAGMIPGRYTGTFSNGTATGNWQGFVGGVDIPLTGRGTDIFPNHEKNPVNSGTQWNVCADSNPNTVFWYGMRSPGGQYFTVGLHSTIGGVCPFLRPAETMAFDTKYDDGKPNSGAILAPNYFASQPASVQCAAGSTWNMSGKTQACHLMFHFFP